MSENEPTPTNSETSRPTDDGYEVALLPWQMRSVFDIDEYGLVFLSGGRGSGKSFTDAPRILRWCDLGTDLYYGIFAPTEAQLNTVLASINKALRELNIRNVYGKNPPQDWMEQWDADGTPYPPQRLRNEKVWIWENGMHIFAATVLNNAYTRAKSLDFNAILFQEATEPGVPDDAFTTLIGCLRCGRATKQRDGSYRCVVPGHIHQMVAAFNVPLRNPSHFIIKKAAGLLKREKERAEAGRAPYFRLIQSKTADNPLTGANYLESLSAALDKETYEEQTSGDLFARRGSLLTYHRFSEANILGSLKYDNTRPLHIWFDFNTTPGTAGWGHDLRYDEVPAVEIRKGHEYFGVVGELFSDNDPMQTEQVARALLEDPTRDERCRDCGHMLGRHFEALWVCRDCGNQCEGKPLSYEWQSSYLHLPPEGHGKPWRGLVNHRARIYVYADATGRNETVTGSALRILRDIFDEALGERVQYRIKDANPPIKLRELAMNRMLRAKDEARSLYIAPWCTAHIDDFREIVPDPKTGVAKKESKPKNPKPGQDYWKRTHETDGLGYMVDYRWPAIIPQASGLPSGPEIEVYEPFATGWREP